MSDIEHCLFTPEQSPAPQASGSAAKVMIPIIAKLIAKVKDSSLAMVLLLFEGMISPVPDTQHGACQLRRPAGFRAFQNKRAAVGVRRSCSFPNRLVRLRTRMMERWNGF